MFLFPIDVIEAIAVSEFTSKYRKLLKKHLSICALSKYVLLLQNLLEAHSAPSSSCLIAFTMRFCLHRKDGVLKCGTEKSEFSFFVCVLLNKIFHHIKKDWWGNFVAVSPNILKVKWKDFGNHLSELIYASFFTRNIFYLSFNAFWCSAMLIFMSI